MDLSGMRKMEREYEAWLDLVQQLKAVGAVTQKDCDSPVDAADTPGQKLFQALRLWGERLAELRLVTEPVSS